MTDQPTVDSELADDFNHLRSIVEQVGRLKLFKKVCETVTGFLNTFTAVRQGYVDGEDITIDEVRFWELASLCEDAFLNALPEGSGNREDLRSQAAQDAEDTEIPELLGVMRPFALVDLTLRKLKLLVLESLSNPYNGEARLPDWDQAILDAQIELENARAVWWDLYASAWSTE